MVSIPSTSTCCAIDTNSAWATAEFGRLSLGDWRANRRFIRCFTRMLNTPGESIPQCTDSMAEAKAFYRLLDDPALTYSAVIDAHRDGVLRRAKASGHQVLLAIQDTTTLNYDNRKSLSGLGSISSNLAKSNVAGLHLHGTLLTSADEDCVHGLLGAKVYARESDKRKKQTPGTRNREPIEVKESYRWIESLELARQAQRVLRQAGADTSDVGPTLISVGDREADIYELLLEADKCRNEGIGLLVRSQHNRHLQDQDEATLWNKVSASESKGEVTIKVPPKQGKKARMATLAVRHLEVNLAVPAHKAKYLKMTQPVRATLVELVETTDDEESIHWRLLTTLEIRCLEEAIKIARWYSKRWQIEEFHRVLKTGCRVEARQLRDLDRLLPMLAMDMVVACYLMGMSASAREQPQVEADIWLNEDELAALATLYPQAETETANDAPEPTRGTPGAKKRPCMSIGVAVKYIGRLGGHLGRKSDGPPGLQCLWRGLTKLRTAAEMFRRLTQPTCG